MTDCHCTYVCDCHETQARALRPELARVMNIAFVDYETPAFKPEVEEDET